MSDHTDDKENKIEESDVTPAGDARAPEEDKLKEGLSLVLEATAEGISSAKDNISKKMEEIDTNEIRLKAQDGINKVGESVKNLNAQSVADQRSVSSIKGFLSTEISSTKFLVWYLIFLVPTYLIRWVAVGSLFEESLSGRSTDGISGSANFLLFACLFALCILAYRRGITIGKKHLVAFPTVALIFDLFLVFIPGVPTVMHIITLVLGVPEKAVPEVSQADELSKLADLKDKGILSEEEFTKRKKEILG